MDDDRRIEISGRDARSATREGVGRYVLGVSLVLAIIALVIAGIVILG